MGSNPTPSAIFACHPAISSGSAGEHFGQTHKPTHKTQPAGLFVRFRPMTEHRLRPFILEPIAFHAVLKLLAADGSATFQRIADHHFEGAFQATYTAADIASLKAIVVGLDDAGFSEFMRKSARLFFDRAAEIQAEMQPRAAYADHEAEKLRAINRAARDLWGSLFAYDATWVAAFAVAPRVSGPAEGFDTAPLSADERDAILTAIGTPLPDNFMDVLRAALLHLVFYGPLFEGLYGVNTRPRRRDVLTPCMVEQCKLWNARFPEDPARRITRNEKPASRISLFLEILYRRMFIPGAQPPSLDEALKRALQHRDLGEPRRPGWRQPTRSSGR